MKTRDQLIVEVLDVLGVTEAGQPASAEDIAKVDEKIDARLAYLAATEVVSVGTAAEFEDAVFQPLAESIAVVCALPFSKAQIRGLDLETFNQLVERKLRRISYSGAENFVTRAEYF